MLIKFEKQSDECVFIIDRNDDVIDHLHKRDGQWYNESGKSFKWLWLAKLYVITSNVAI